MYDGRLVWEGHLMEAGVHLPQIDFGGDVSSTRRLVETVESARRCGFVAVSANDHFVFGRPWLDGLTLLARASERSGEMDLLTSVALPTLRGPVVLARAIATLQELSAGRVIAGVAAGSSRADYEAVGVPFEERWARLDEAVGVMKPLLHLPPPALGLGSPDGRIPLWLGSWGSPAGLRRVARSGDGWLASAYNIDPERFASALDALGVELHEQGVSPSGFPHALVTMWTRVTDRRAEADRFIEIVATVVRRDPEQIRERICVGSADRCAELLSHYARAGCRRVHFWPVGDEARQIDLIATRVLPQVIV
jgi:alkanesulfonate monooxygenase SsuD/methylene tetrahydromethanopterin reductase-like flavin-dependent oxidoreductase (luciferase family)